MREERRHFGRPHVAGVTTGMELEESPNPTDIGFLGAEAVVMESQGLDDVVVELRGGFVREEPQGRTMLCC
jgi:hypothetical protein